MLLLADWLPDPIPLPGDLRVACLLGLDVGPHLAGRWQIQRYDAATGMWCALAGTQARRRGYWRGTPTFGTEAEALAYVVAVVRRRRGRGERRERRSRQ